MEHFEWQGDHCVLTLSVRLGGRGESSCSTNKNHKSGALQAWEACRRHQAYWHTGCCRALTILSLPHAIPNTFPGVVVFDVVYTETKVFRAASLAHVDPVTDTKFRPSLVDKPVCCQTALALHFHLSYFFSLRVSTP